MVVLESTIPNFRTKTPAVFFLSEIPKSRGKKKPRKIGPHRGRKEIVCGYKEEKKPYPFGPPDVFLQKKGENNIYPNLIYV